MKLVFVTDTHARAKNPISRKDDFQATVMKKLSWVVDYANSIDATIIHGGDWLQRPDVSPNLIGMLGKILLKAKNPIYSVIGNHDIYSYNIDTFERTPLSILTKCGIITQIPQDVLLEIGDNVFLKGVSAHPLLDKNGRTCDYKISYEESEGRDGIYILVVHGFLADHDWGPNVPHTKIDDTVEGNVADFVLTGHEHSGYGIIEKHDGPHKISYCNPGSLLRVTAGVGDMRDEVRVAVIDTEAETIELVNVDIAKPADEVLDRDKLVEEKERAKTLELFAEKASQISRNILLEPTEQKSISDLLDEYINALKEDEELKDLISSETILEAHNLLSEAELADQESKKKRRADE